MKRCFVPLADNIKIAPFVKCSGSWLILSCLKDCLKRPSLYCLIHFYKRCVSALAQIGRSPWVRSGWVSVLVSHKHLSSGLRKASSTKRIPKRASVWNFLHQGFRYMLYDMLLFASLQQGVRVSLFPFSGVVIGRPSLLVYRDQAINAWFTSLRGVCHHWDLFPLRKISKFFYWLMKAANIKKSTK